MQHVEADARTIITTRVVNAKRENVFASWTDPAILVRWWGPKGFTNTFHRFELEPGGMWDFTMHGPDGANYANTCVFREIVRNERIVFDHLKEMHFYHAEIHLSDTPAGTRIEWSMRFNTVEELDPIRSFIEAANEQNLDKLESELNGR